MEKIKINLDKSTLTKLNNDIINFSYLKENKDINKNGFLNNLLANYFPIYNNIASKHIERYNKIISCHLSNKDISNSIINDLIATNKFFSYNKKSSLDASISFKPINSNKKIINIIVNEYTKHQSLSSFFRNMIEHYLSLPQYQREQIIYLNTYQLIQDAIKDKRKITIYYENKNTIILPYKIVTNNEENYSYLIGLNETNHVVSFHLYKLKEIYLLKETFSLNDKDIDKLDKVALNYPQFPHDSDQETIIELTCAGVKMYNKKYLNRPTPYKIENNTYYFNCSHSQIVLYFFAFAKNAKVIFPSSIKDTFKNMYLEAYENYK